MTTVTRQEFIDWIMAQPDDKMVNMRDCVVNDECGCVMVQYGLEKFGYDSFVHCTGREWLDKTAEALFPAIAKFAPEFDIYDLLNLDEWRSISTYEDVKRILNQ